MKPDWQNHLINFVLIVFSILMAFQLERCAEDGRQDRLVEAHLAEIREETQFNQMRIDETVKAMRESIERLDTLLHLIHSSDDAERINRMVFEAMNVPAAYLKKTAYTSFVETGDIRYLDEFARKSELVSLYEYYKLTETYGQLLLATYEDGFFDYIQDHLDLYRTQPAPIEVYRERSFVNALSSIRYFLQRNVTNLERDRARMDDFITAK